MRPAAGLAAALVAALLIVGCGSDALSDSQLRSRASRICPQAQRRAARIASPSTPAGRRGS